MEIVPVTVAFHLPIPAYNFLLYSEGSGTCFGFSPYPLLSQHGCICSLLLLLQLSKWYLSAPWCLLCTLSEDPDPSLVWASKWRLLEDWMWGFREQLSETSQFLIPSSLCCCDQVCELVWVHPCFIPTCILQMHCL